MIGKVSAELLATYVIERTGTSDPSVLQGPAYGEDTAAIDLGHQILVVNADPLSLAADQVGTLGVHVVCNDVAASGARPRWLTNTMFLPDDDPGLLDEITHQLDETARALDVAIVGGHAEYFPVLERPLLSFAAFGLTDSYVPSGGAQVGDEVVLAGAAGLEGTAILATDFSATLRAKEVDPATISRAASFIEEISVIDAGSILASVATGMHDPTEGGILTGLVEMANAAKHRFEIEESSIPIRETTRRICAVMQVDPLRIFGSGALLATVPPEASEEIIACLDQHGISATVIGTVADGPAGVAIDGSLETTAPRDQLYALWE